MKKLYACIALAIVACALVAAEGINLGDFPKGKWLDAKWNAVWEFGADNIRILDTAGAEVYSFKNKITDFKVDVGLTEAKISFTCKDAGRKYTFVKGIKDLDLAMEIDPDWTTTNYKATLPFQK